MASPAVDIYQDSNYRWKRAEEPRLQKRYFLFDRLARIRELYPVQGMRTTVEGLLLIWTHNHPRVILMKCQDGYYELPGGRIKGQETDIEGLKRKLNKRFAFRDPGLQIQWEIGEIVGVWWRPNYNNKMYPICPPNVQPKECRKIFLVHLPERAQFSTPNNIDVVAVSLLEMCSSVQKYGPRLASLALQLSRFELRMVHSVSVRLNRSLPNIR